MKTYELTGRTLDWAVEKANGTFWSENGYFCFKNPERYDHNPEWAYSTGPAGDDIIDREKIDTLFDPNGTAGWMGRMWKDFKEIRAFGATRRIAAMRCYVASRLGDEIQIPEELK